MQERGQSYEKDKLIFIKSNQTTIQLTVRNSFLIYQQKQSNRMRLSLIYSFETQLLHDRKKYVSC